MISLLIHILLLFQGMGAVDTGNCNKLWGMSNTINNVNLYSMDLYMCETYPGQSQSDDISITSPSSSKITELNGIKDFLSRTYNLTTNETSINNITNKILTNITQSNNSTTNIDELSLTPSQVHSPSSMNVPSPMNVPSSYKNIAPSPSSFFSDLINFSPSSTSKKQISPSPYITPSPITPSSTNDNLNTHIVDDDQKDSQVYKVLNKKNETKKETTIQNEDNTFIVVTIILSCILLLIIIGVLIRFFVKRNNCKLRKTRPEEKEEIDLEIGEKNKKIEKKAPIQTMKPMAIKKPALAALASSVPMPKKKKIGGGRGKQHIRKTKLNLKTIKQFGQRKTDNVESPAIKKIVNKDSITYNMKPKTQEKLKEIQNKESNLQDGEKNGEKII